MKHFIIFLLAALTLFATLTSCKEEALSFEYSFTISGHANGDVSVAFPGGKLDMKGGSELEFGYSSGPVDTTLLKGLPLFTGKELSGEGNPKLMKAVYSVKEGYEDQFTASSASGTYYLHVTGTVRERLTGIEVKIDKTLTNEEPADQEAANQ